MNNITSLARVILRNGSLASYRHLEDQEEEIIDLSRTLSLEPGEKILGIYQNEPLRDADSIVVTTEGLHLLRSGQFNIMIRYGTIESVAGTRPSNKCDTELTVQLRNGAVQQLSVRGQKGKFRDIFEFTRFLMRAVDRAKEQPE